MAYPGDFVTANRAARNARYHFIPHGKKAQAQARSKAHLFPLLGLADQAHCITRLLVTNSEKDAVSPGAAARALGCFFDDPDLTLSRHPARATARRLPPSIGHRVPPVAG
jgi:hypothetical protein